MDNPSRLPIKVVMPNQGQHTKRQGGGGGGKSFKTVDAAYRQGLSNQIGAIRDLFSSKSINVDSAPVRVRMVKKAEAKSHRPHKLFSDKTCPIIGAGRLGEIYVKATRNGLDALDQKILENKTKGIITEISAIESIEPITSDFRRKKRSSKAILADSPRSEDGFITKVRLFDYGEDQGQIQLVEDFLKHCQEEDIKVEQTGYSDDSYTYAVECQTVNDVESISEIVGVRSIQSMPIIRIIKPQVFNPTTLPPLPKRNQGDQDIPVVVVVDSGVTDAHPELNSWVVGRHNDVAPAYRNTEHGSFVAGLICWGSQLNPNLAELNDGVCGVFDLAVIPNYDPAKGPIDSLSESSFLQSLESALVQYSNKYKVWNLSIGTNQVCSLDDFSEFAVELDNLQEKYQVSFVVSAGNYNGLPQLSFPRAGNQLPNGRITAPADTVLGISVGAVSHIDYKSNGPKDNELSPFSRHGPGPNHIIKPDLVHYGGTSAYDANHRFGVRSIAGGQAAENNGTSFSAPLVSRTLAQIYHSVTPTPSPVLARALLTHHARDPRTLGRVPDKEENFFGFGIPQPLPYCIECTPHSATLIFEDTLRPGYFLEWDKFPYPPSLYRDGRYFGEVSMTIAFSPSRGARWGTEYCETNIDAYFGVYYDQKVKKTGRTETKYRSLVPPEHKNAQELYENVQIQTLRKWAPVRTYYGDMGEKGERGKRWRLKLELLTRHEKQSPRIKKPQPFSVIVTIRDPERKVPVYNEMTTLLRTRFQTENLAVRMPIQVQKKVS